MPLQATSGAASYDAFGGGVPVVNYIEDMFSTYLYTGNGTSQTITNNIDLSGKGGLVWFKNRSSTNNHALYDTARGVTKRLSTSQTGGTGAQVTDVTSLTAFNSNGFSVAADNSQNENTFTFASWTFRKQPKFFDVVTYTGNGTNGRAISHALGSVPGCIMVKSTSNTSDWIVYHRSLSSPTTKALYLNGTNAELSGAYFPTTPTSTVFYTNGDGYDVNTTGQTYVAYLFAHNAGGFGLSGSDNVITCGSVVGTGNPTEITLGYEPQWLLIKNADSTQDWWLLDNMRGLIVENAASSKRLNANDSAAETGLNVRPTATGFINGVMTVGQNYIYIAIRRGPMKVPTTGTSVFEPVAYTGNGTNPRTVGTLQATDLAINMNRSGAGDVPLWVDRLRGQERYLYSSGTGAEDGGLTGWLLGQSGQTINGVRNTSPTTYIDWLFKRAPSFFDEVCYTATGSNGLIVNHNLGVIPELILLKSRTGARGWEINFNFTSTQCKRLQFTTTAGNVFLNYGANGNAQYVQPTSSQLSLTGSTNAPNINTSGETCVAYLFASLAGVSKIGTYAGNGSSQTINCGFTAGARFVLIKQITDSSGWIVFDTARGIVSGNDPYLQLQSTAAEVTTQDVVDTDNSGFVVNETSGPNMNTNGETYLFFAIA